MSVAIERCPKCGGGTALNTRTEEERRLAPFGVTVHCPACGWNQQHPDSVFLPTDLGRLPA